MNSWAPCLYLPHIFPTDVFSVFASTRKQEPHDIFQCPLGKVHHTYLFSMLTIGNPSPSFYLPNGIQPTGTLTLNMQDANVIMFNATPPRYCLKMVGNILHFLGVTRKFLVMLVTFGAVNVKHKVRCPSQGKLPALYISLFE